MIMQTFHRRATMLPTVLTGLTVLTALTVLTLAACASAASSASVAARQQGGADMSLAAPSPDPRLGLKAGWFNAQEAAWNLSLVSTTPPSNDFINRADPGDQRVWNSDLAFTGNYVIQGNFAGYQVWDVSNPAQPRLHASYLCIGSQSDVSVYHNLLFESTEATNARLDCSPDGVRDTVSRDRARGIRVYDITDIAHPRRVATVQTCRGSHTHTVVTDPNDDKNVYIYVSGSAPVRSNAELSGCIDVDPKDDASTERFRIEVIQVPVAHPEQAHVVSKPAILADLGVARGHGENAADEAQMLERMKAAGISAADLARTRQTSTGPIQCHDITVYPAIGLGAGACRGYGVLLDIRNPAQPRRIGVAADTNFVAWHSATFNNDGSKLLFTDEWGGGTSPRCRSTDKMEWGADAIFALAPGGTMTFGSYYKLPAAQTPTENCVAHNGSLIPVPGRDIMAQGWYQGGISVFDFTDPRHVREIAFFDRGPMDSTKLFVSGSWSAYWYNGMIYSSEITRGLDVFRLQPSAWLTQNEIDAANSVHLSELNVQSQPQFTWAPSFAVARAYLDQLARGNGLAADRISAARDALASAERASGDERRGALTQLASRLDGDASGAADAGKVRKLGAVVRDLGR
jgi:hypothetical protein